MYALEVQGEAGRLFQVEVSDDLVNWEVLVDTAIGADGLTQIVDEEGFGANCSFYRLVVP